MGREDPPQKNAACMRTHINSQCTHMCMFPAKYARIHISAGSVRAHAYPKIVIFLKIKVQDKIMTKKKIKKEDNATSIGSQDTVCKPLQHALNTLERRAIMATKPIKPRRPKN